MKGIRYFSQLPGTGMGNAAEGYLSAIAAADIPLTWTPLAYATGTWGRGYPLAPVAGPADPGWRHRDLVAAAVDYDTTIVHSTPLWPPASALRPGSRRFAYVTFEADRLPGRWLAILRRFDGLLVPSQHSLQVCRDSGLSNPVTVVPHIATPARTARRGDLGLPDDAMVFYLIATWTMRKAVPDAVRAFLAAFTAADNVALVLKTSAHDRVALHRAALHQAGLHQAACGPHEGMSWFSLARLLAGYPSPPPIRLIAGEARPDVIAELHARGDCFVSLSRGEGWNLGAFEAGAAGNPVLVTGWGGHLDYLPDGYPYLIRYDLVPTTAEAADDWFEAEPGQRWARADLAHASALLRSIYDHRAEAARWGQRLREHILARFTARQVTPRLLDAIGGVTIPSGYDPSA